MSEYFFLLRFTRHLSDRLKAFAGQNENLPVLSGSPALFAKSGLEPAFARSVGQRLTLSVKGQLKVLNMS